MLIETKRLMLRCFSEGDFADLQQILGDAQCMEYLEPPYAPERTRAFLNRFCIAQKGALAAGEKKSAIFYFMRLKRRFMRSAGYSTERFGAEVTPMRRAPL